MADIKVTEHLSPELIERYRAQQLHPGERRLIRAHTQACETCRGRLTDYESLVVKLRAEKKQWQNFSEADLTHPNASLLERFVHGNVNPNEAEILGTHLEMCRACTNEADKLKSIQRETQAYRSVKVRKWRKLFGNLFASFGSGLRPRLVLAALLALVAVGAGLIYFFVANERQSDSLTKQNPLPTKNENQPTPAPPLQQDDVNRNEDAARLVNENTPPKDKQNQGTQSIKPKGNDASLLARNSTRYSTSGLTPAQLGLIDRAVNSKTLTPPEILSALRSKEIRLMGVEGNATSRRESPLNLISPSGIVVSTTKPTFRWEPAEGATNYQVSVFNSKFQKLTSPRITKTEWTMESSLQAGEVYSWNVIAYKRDGSELKSPTDSLPPVRFKILEGDRLEAIRRAHTHLENKPLALGVLLASEGLVDEAREQFEKAIAAGGSDTNAAKRFLTQLQSWKTAPPSPPRP